MIGSDSGSEDSTEKSVMIQSEPLALHPLKDLDLEALAENTIHIIPSMRYLCLDGKHIPLRVWEAGCSSHADGENSRQPIRPDEEEGRQIIFSSVLHRDTTG